MVGIDCISKRVAVDYAGLCFAERLTFFLSFCIKKWLSNLRQTATFSIYIAN
jgi:hypothetical protein